MKTAMIATMAILTLTSLTNAITNLFQFEVLMPMKAKAGMEPPLLLPAFLLIRLCFVNMDLHNFAIYGKSNTKRQGDYLKFGALQR